MLTPIDWAQVFLPDTPVLEIIARGSVMYLALLGMLRLYGNRGTGTLGVSDVLVIVLLADAAQNAMAGSYTSIADGLLLVFTIMAWDYFIDWLVFRFPIVERIFKPTRTCLVKNGRILWRNMRAEYVTKSELLEQLRIHEIEDVKEVKSACLEPNGEVSVIKYKK